MSAIYKRELKSLFSGMIAPLFLAFLILFSGAITVAHLQAGDVHFETSVPSIGIVFLYIIPLLTMQSFAAEKAAKTDQALYALPVSSFSVVTGKFLAMVTVLGVSSAMMCLSPLILSLFGNIYFPTAYAAIFAFFMM